MTKIFDLIKLVFDVLVAIWDFISGAFRGAIECGKAMLSVLALVDDAISMMPPIIIPFMYGTIFILILYLIIGLVTGGES